MTGKYVNVQPDAKVLSIPIDRENPATMNAEFLFRLQEWAIKEFGSKEEAAEKLGVTERTLNNWKNK